MQEILIKDNKQILVERGTKINHGDSVIALRSKVIDEVVEKSGILYLKNATRENNWPTKFKPEYYGKIIEIIEN